MTWDNRNRTAACERCGRVRQLRSSGPVPPLCQDCRYVEPDWPNVVYNDMSEPA